jgi:hypothetical protein
MMVKSMRKSRTSTSRTFVKHTQRIKSRKKKVPSKKTSRSKNSRKNKHSTKNKIKKTRKRNKLRKPTKKIMKGGQKVCDSIVPKKDIKGNLIFAEDGTVQPTQCKLYAIDGSDFCKLHTCKKVNCSNNNNGFLDFCYKDLTPVQQKWVDQIIYRDEAARE